MKAGIIILAAGESARMGEPKQLLEFRGTTLLIRTIDTALAVPDVKIVVVLGAHATDIHEVVQKKEVLTVENPDWRKGMGGSIRSGLSALLAVEPEVPAVIFLTCDQPFLTPVTLANLISTHERSGSRIVASEYGDTVGIPVLFARSLFPELLALDGEIGARRIIRKHREQTLAIPFPGGEVDIDTPGDYLKLREASGGLTTFTNV